MGPQIHFRGAGDRRVAIGVWSGSCAVGSDIAMVPYIFFGECRYDALHFYYFSDYVAMVPYIFSDYVAMMPYIFSGYVAMVPYIFFYL